MKRIYRYHLGIDDRPDARLPIGARVLSVAAARAEGSRYLELWALVDPDADSEDRYFRIFGTGHPVDEDFLGRFIGTVSMAGGALIWHVFEDVL